MRAVATLVFFNEQTALEGAARAQRTLPNGGVRLRLRYKAGEFHLAIYPVPLRVLQCLDFVYSLRPDGWPGLMCVEIPHLFANA